MDDEDSFAKLLSQSTSAPPPRWSPTASTTDDPWANPFSDEPSSNPFANSASPFGPSTSTFASPESPVAQHGFGDSSSVGVGFSGYSNRALESPKAEVSPYVQQLEHDAIGRPPDPPSVIAAREQDAAVNSTGFQSPYNSPFRPADQPYTSPYAASGSTLDNSAADQSTQTRSRKLPDGLIDEDLLAASDPSQSLKKAFVKSSPSSKALFGDSKEPGSSEPYVFTPSKKGKSAEVKVESPAKAAVVNGAATTTQDTQRSDPSAKTQHASPKVNGERKSTPASIPLPESTDVTPTATRTVTPNPDAALPDRPPFESSGSSIVSVTPSDRVDVSPLDSVTPNSDYGFKSLAIGASGSSASTAEPLGNGPGSAGRFGGKGWGAMDDENDGGFFGRGGPSTRSTEGWNGNGVEGGWGETGVPPTPPSVSTDLPSESSESQTEDDAEASTAPVDEARRAARSSTTFRIAVGDPTKVGDPVRGYTVYTIRTHTNSPHYRRSDFSVLRRFSDFLWLFECLTANNPGVIVPPVPDKHPFGRFQDTFIETRRNALQRCLEKITSHPVLQLDPDLRLFLESDCFAAEAKNRKAENVPDKTGILATWTGPKFVEQDDWFDSRRLFLDSLEAQLRGLSKSIEAASKSRLDMALAMGDFASSMANLAESDLGSAMCAAIGRLSNLASREKETNEELATADVVNLLNLSDEYVRFISSVRLAFVSRIKCFEKWKNQEREVGRLKQAREKARQQGRLGDRVNQSLAEIGEADRKARDAGSEFETVSRLVKSEFARFEKERVEEFKRTLEKHLDLQITRQKEIITAWEEYHGVVLRMIQRAQAT